MKEKIIKIHQTWNFYAVRNSTKESQAAETGHEWTARRWGDPIPIKWPGQWVACGVGDVAICHRVTAACQVHWTVGDPWGTKDTQGCNVLVLQYHEPACLIDCGPSPKVEALNVSMEDLSLPGWMSSPACWTPFAETSPMWSVREYGTFTWNYWDDVCPRQDSQAWVLHEDKTLARAWSE